MFCCVLRVCSISSRAVIGIIRWLCLFITAICAVSIFIRHGNALSTRFRGAFHCIATSFILGRCIIPTFGLFSIGRCLFCSFRRINLGLENFLTFTATYDYFRVIDGFSHFIGNVDYFMLVFFQDLIDINFGSALTYCSWFKETFILLSVSHEVMRFIINYEV